ncbi:ATP-dependent RNA helicase chl1 [Thecamonas trahens ATCC 50062]|uniref:ATP-dependent RNA helicase chl1 n=1 Tax=Thecamonas trahens ATCC 50062 TaxID=461836 RepID=A0A0L0D3S3_THETB|nr:ATP-dependent RNA helicase chl1 [Thecamonas trahens ATCC 50062]KNC45953.1 ATP-dependent RNA helicase chl1 [Thecamonas trahens ATCC 50062]|eukprot:XP_013762934.1 ATP-dependent RNA helicase chl1 [Thecamonas trahens ATCC 50062]
MNYSFPFDEPYSVQIQLMDALSKVLAVTPATGPASLAVLESPTGTGKSLSLICATLTWLTSCGRDIASKRLALAAARDMARTLASAARETKVPLPKPAPRLPAWVSQHAATAEADDAATTRAEMDAEDKALRRILASATSRLATGSAATDALDGMARARARARARLLNQAGPSATPLATDPNPPAMSAFEAEIEAKFGSSAPMPPPELDDSGAAPDDAFIVDLVPDGLPALMLELDALNDDENRTTSRRARHEASTLGGVPLPNLAQATKVYYCSRTHSQIAQFVDEIRGTAFADAGLRVITLGSRKQLCINPKINKPSSSVASINDACRDARSKTKAPRSKRKRESSACGCPFYEPMATAAAPQPSYPVYALTEIRTLDELARLGTSLSSCPYFGTRRAVAGADLVALPYTMLVHEGTRAALGIDLTGAVIVVDEAHNLVDAINAVHSVTVTAAAVSRARAQLNAYFERYRSRLSAYNRDSLLTILNVVSSFSAYFASLPPSASQPGTKAVLPVNEFLHSATLGIDHFNPFDMRKYLDASQLLNKLLGFAAAAAAEAQAPGDDDGGGEDAQARPPPPADSPLRNIIAFLEAVNHPLAAEHGRILLAAHPETGTLSVKHLVLNPSVYFAPLVADAHAVVLAGGTLQPVDELLIQLLGPQRASEVAVTQAPASPVPGGVSLFSCDHVVDPSSLLTLVVGVSPLDPSTRFRFTYSRRDALIPHAVRALANFANVSPGGMVVFSRQPVLSHRKPVFRETARGSGAEVLARYAQTVAANPRRGALLSCVIGGKMSEGINFSDDLGRLIVVVGVPYPPPNDPELNARLDFVASAKAAAGNAPAPGTNRARISGMATMCMKGVNQSIGRAIRHKNDYASIVLLDERYALDATLFSLLPAWIMRNSAAAVASPPSSSSLSHATSFGASIRSLVLFWKAIRQRNEISAGPSVSGAANP